MAASLQGANLTQADLDDAYMTPVNVTGVGLG